MGGTDPYARGERWPELVDMQLEDGLDSNGDGIDIAVRDGRIAGVRGRA